MNKFISVIITIICLIFFAAVAFDISPLLRGPGMGQWQWPYQFINTLNKAYLPILVLGVILLVFRKIEKVKIKKELLVLLLVIILSFLFQLSVVYFSRAGIGVLLHRITDPGLNGYFTAGINIANPVNFVTDFPNIVLNLPMHAKGHPPGIPLFFYFLNWLIPITNKYIAMVIGVSFALLNSITIVPLFFAVKKRMDLVAAWRAVFLYFSIPSLTLFLPLPDGFFPFFGILSVCLIIYKKHFLAGLVFAVGLFFSYSILPVLFFLLLFKPKPSFFIPIILYFLIFWQTFLTVIGGQAERPYLIWLIYNLWDFIVFAGLPLAIMFLFSFKKSWPMILVLLALDLSGTSRAETGRIWVPMMVFMIFPVVEFLRERKMSTNFVMILLALQFIQTLVIQEFWVPLW